MKKIASLAAMAAVAGACLTATPVYSLEKGDWLFRFGAASVMPNDDSSTVSTLPNSGVSVDDATAVGLTLTYMYTDNIGFELLAATPFEHDLNGTGSIDGVKIGTTKHLPPSLVGQYYFQPESNVRPYVGAGLNYTSFFDEEADPQLEATLGGNTSVSLDESFGLTVMAGVDVDLTDNWFFNSSLWYMQIDTEATLNTGGTVRTVDVDIDPWALMVGVGLRF